MNNKVLIFSAPSGSGKSTIVNHILGKADYDHADVNGDGVIDITDVNAAINHILGKD